MTIQRNHAHSSHLLLALLAASLPLGCVLDEADLVAPGTDDSFGGDKADNSCDSPYARDPDGCSSPISDNPEQFRDKWGPVNFGTECDKHDRCYYTLGANPHECNREFRDNLHRACRNGLTRRVKVCLLPRPGGGCAHWGITDTPPVPGVYSACLAFADGMYLAVEAGVALGVFDEAQDRQRAHEQRCSAPPAARNETTVRQAYCRVLRRGADGGGLANWAAWLQQGNPPRELVRTFVHSAEFDNGFVRGRSTADVVTALYDAILARGPGGEGIAAWSGYVEQHGYRAAANGIVDSPEYTNRFGPDRIPGEGRAGCN